MQTPDWGFLDSGFSGKIKVGDIDGIVEANGCALILEWKRKGEIPTGQRIMFEKLTRKNHIVIFVVYGDPETSIVEKLIVYRNGTVTLEAICSCDELIEHCKNWESRARGGSI